MNEEMPTLGSTVYEYSVIDSEELRACVNCNTTIYGALMCFQGKFSEDYGRLLHLWLPMAEQMMKEKK